MAKSLKQRNQPQLITFTISNAMALGMIALGIPTLLSILTDFTRGNVTVLGKLIAIPALLSLITGTIGWAMPRVAKEVLVFWKSGKTALPSSRAFTVIGHRDPRVDMPRLDGRYGPLPTVPAEQTALWYRIYRMHNEDASVEDAHGAYLRFREMTTLIVALVGLSIVGAICLHVSRTQLILGLGLLLLEYVVLMFAARNAATHFVSNVLALESALSTAGTIKQ